MDAVGSHNAADRSNVLLPAGRNAAAALRHQGTIAAASATCRRYLRQKLSLLSGALPPAAFA
jgi:hypothetical protein